MKASECLRLRFVIESVDEWTPRGALDDEYDYGPAVGRNLLYEYLKHRLPDDSSDGSFLSSLRSKIPLSVVIQWICKDANLTAKQSIFVINFDEVNKVLEKPTGQSVFAAVVKVLREQSRTGKAVFFILLSSTVPIAMRDAVKLSGSEPIDIPLPLLTIEHMEEVAADMHDRCLAASSPTSTTGSSPSSSTDLSYEFQFLLSSLSGHCRSLQFLLFLMGCKEGDLSIFDPATFLQSYDRLNYVGKEVSDTHQYANDLFGSLVHFMVHKRSQALKDKHDIIPELIGHTLFNHPMSRTEKVGKQWTVAQLEQEGIVFLERPASSSSSSATDSQLLLALPYIWVRFYYTSNRLSKWWSDIPLLTSANLVLTPTVNEQLSISVLAFKLYYLWKYRQSAKSKLTPTKKHLHLSDIFPIRDNQKQKDLRIKGLPTKDEEWRVEQLPHKIENQSQLNEIRGGWFFINAHQASYADSFALCDPVIFIQDKQSLTQRRADAKRRKSDFQSHNSNTPTNPLPATSSSATRHQPARTCNATPSTPSAAFEPSSITEMMAVEHRKYLPLKRRHVFVLITDWEVTTEDEATLKHNEILIHPGNQSQFFGHMLSQRKQHLFTGYQCRSSL